MILPGAMRAMSRVGLVIEGMDALGSDSFFRPIERELCKRHRVARFQPRFAYAPLVGGRLNKLLLRLQLAHFLRSHDIVFFEWAGPLLVRASNNPRDCRIVTRLHSIEVCHTAHLVNWTNVDEVIVVSGHMRQRLLEATVAPPASIHVIHNGVDLARFRPALRGFDSRIGMVCRVSPLKRVYEAVLTLATLRSQGHAFSLHVAGPLGKERNPRYALALRELVAKLGLADCVTFYGQEDNIPAWLERIDVFLSNSYWEGLSLALLEAMASGCYCLAHCYGGAEEVLPPQNIYATDADLQARLLCYATLGETEKQQAQLGMRRIAEEKFDQRRMVRETVEVVEKAAAI